MQADQRSFRVRQVADDLADRLRQLPHQGRNGDDLVVPCQPRVLDEVDHFDLELARQVLLAESLEIGEGRDGLRRLPGDVQAQLPLLRLLRLRPPDRSIWAALSFATFLWG